jgi:hypothetical protein
MEKRKNNHIIKLTATLWCIWAMLLCASPCNAETVNTGETADINYAIDDFLVVLGTANLYPGAYVDLGIYAYFGSTVNIYGGKIGDGYGITLMSVEPIPVVKVYGTYFELDDVPLDPMADHFFTDESTGESVLKGTYENGDLINLLFLSDVPIFLRYPDTGITTIDIDIRPYSNNNCINLDIKGFVPVAVLTTDDFDAATVDPATVEFAGAAPVCWRLRDVDRDGDDDMILHFRIQELNLDQDSTEATLTGQTTQGILIEGSDEVQIFSSCRKCLIKKFSGYTHRPVWWKCKRPVIPPVKGCKRNANNGCHQSDCRKNASNHGKCPGSHGRH